MSSIKFDINTLDRCNNILRYNIKTFLDLYRLFIANNQPLIVQYFQNTDQMADVFSFDFLSKLQIESKKINDLFNIYSNSFNRVDDWYLLNTLTDINTKLETISNLDKWLRSNKTKNNLNQVSIQFNQLLEEGETIEKLSQDNNYTDPQNDWMKIAVENNLLESDYDLRGGESIELHKKILSQPNIFLNSIIDRGLSGEKLYGLDFDKTIKWVNNDLSVLSYKDTVLQSVTILIELRKGDIPEFSDFGVDERLTVGRNLSVLRDFRLKKDFQTVFNSDDSLRNFKINDISYYNGKLWINYSIDTMYNLTVQKGITL